MLQPFGKLSVYIKQHFGIGARSRVHRIEALGQRDLRPHRLVFLKHSVQGGLRVKIRAVIVADLLAATAKGKRNRKE